MSERDGQASCKEDRRDTSKPEITGALKEGEDRVGESREVADLGRNSPKGVKPRS